MADLTAFKQDLMRLIEAGASQEDIDAFFEEEGITRDDKAVSLSRTEKALEGASEAIENGFGELGDKMDAVMSVLAGEIARMNASLGQSVGDTGQTLSQTLQKLESRVLAGSAKGQSSMEKRVSALESHLAEIKSTQAGINGMFEKLLTAQRVPVRNGKGELVGVELRTQS